MHWLSRHYCKPADALQYTDKAKVVGPHVLDAHYSMSITHLSILPGCEDGEHHHKGSQQTLLAPLRNQASQVAQHQGGCNKEEAGGLSLPIAQTFFESQSCGSSFWRMLSASAGPGT